MTTKEKAIKHVREVCPELMELSFGCEVELQLGDLYGDRAFVTYECGKCIKHKLSKNCDMDCDIEDAVSVVRFGYLDEATEWLFLKNDKEIKVIGHPIHLEHWLRAVAQSESIAKCTVSHDGTEFISFSPDFAYNLTLPYDQQSEEFYQAYCDIVGI